MRIRSDVLDDYRQIMGIDFGPFAVDLVNSYLRDVPEFLQKLQWAMSTQDDELFIRTAHTLKSNSLIFGARQLAELAGVLERTGIASSGTGLLLGLEQEYARVKGALVDFRQELLQEG